VVSGCSSSLRSVHCYGRFTLGIRLGLFPLGLRTPCSFVPPVPRQCAVLGAGSGRLLFGGRKASFPQLGLLLVPSESALRTTPFLVFILAFVVSLPLFTFSDFDWGGVRPSAWTLLAETARGGMQMLAPSPREYTRTFPTRARTRGLPLQIFEYTTPCPVLPTCLILFSFSSADKYLVAVASETCRSFSTSSLVILFFVFSAAIILSRFLRLRF
jgi:hypothetical protein